jgi:hypothetical protein
LIPSQNTEVRIGEAFKQIRRAVDRGHPYSIVPGTSKQAC